MAISPELQKLLDGAKVNLPTPVPYAPAPIQIQQAPVQQEPAFSNIQLPQPFPQPVQNSTFSPISPTFTPIKPLTFEQFQTWQWVNNEIQPIQLPNIQTQDDKTLNDTINENLNDLWYSSLTQATQWIQSEYDAAGWEWLFNQLNRLSTLPAQWMQKVWDIVLWWSDIWKSIKEWIWNIREYFWTEDIASKPLDWSIWLFAPFAELSTAYSKKKVDKIESIIWKWFDKDNENRRIDYSKSIESDISEYLPRPKNLNQLEFDTYNKIRNQQLWEMKNLLIPYMWSIDNRIYEAKLQWNQEEIDFLNSLKEHNKKQIIKQTSTYIRMLTDVQNWNPELTDRQASQIVNDQIWTQYRDVNGFLQDWLKKLNWEILNTKISEEYENVKWFWVEWYNSNDLSQLRTAEEFLLNQWNELDRRTINEKWWAWSVVYANIAKLITPISNLLNRVAAKTFVEIPFWWETASADFWYLPTLSYANRQKNVWDVVLPVTQQVLDVVPEVATNIWVSIATWPLSSANAIRWLNVSKSAWWMLNINKVKWIAETLKQLWKLTLWETIQNAFVDPNTANYNNPSNMTANLIWWIIGNTMDFIKIWNNRRDIYKADDAIWILRANARAQKHIDLIAEWKTIEEAKDLVSKMTDDELVWTEINVDYVNKVIKDQESLKKAINDDKKAYQYKVDQLTKEAKWLSWEDLLKKQAEIYDAQRILDNQSTIIAKRAWEVAFINKFMQNPTEEWVEEFTRALSTFKPWELKLSIDDVYRLYQSSPLWLQTKASEALYTNILKSTDWYKKAKEIEWITWLSATKSYTIKDLDDVMKKARDSEMSEVKRITEKEWDKFKYFNVENWEYSLNAEWIKKMNLTDSEPIIQIRRELRWVTETEAWDLYKQIIEKNQAELWISNEDLEKIKSTNAYDELLQQVNQFIPCII